MEWFHCPLLLSSLLTSAFKHNLCVRLVIKTHNHKVDENLIVCMKTRNKRESQCFLISWSNIKHAYWAWQDQREMMVLIWIMIFLEDQNKISKLIKILNWSSSTWVRQRGQQSSPHNIHRVPSLKSPPSHQPLYRTVHTNHLHLYLFLQAMGLLFIKSVDFSLRICEIEWPFSAVKVTLLYIWESVMPLFWFG